jgi:hypothetical protein
MLFGSLLHLPPPLTPLSRREHGFDTYISKVGGFGVKWHGHTPPPAPPTIMRVGRDVATNDPVKSSVSKSVFVLFFFDPPSAQAGIRRSQ